MYHTGLFIIINKLVIIYKFLQRIQMNLGTLCLVNQQAKVLDEIKIEVLTSYMVDLEVESKKW